MGSYRLSFLFFLFLVFLIGAVLAVGWNTTFGPSSYGSEDSPYFYNLSANVSGYNPTTMNFTIIDIDAVTGQTRINWNGILINWTTLSWISFNDSTGNLTFKAITNNQTGNFVIKFLVSEGTSSSGENFNFTILALNDAPDFTLSSNYTTGVNDVNVSYNFSLVGSDEEKQYPLVYNLSFGGCALASWSSRIASNNCNLTYTLSNISNTTSVLNFTSLTNDDIGNYNITICVQDNINGSALPSYRDANYENNQTRCKNTTIIVEKALTVNFSDCDGRILQENQSFSCKLNVSSKGLSDSLRVWTNATLSRTGARASNSSWFFTSNFSNSTNFLQIYYTNVTPQKLEIGNWSINFTARDLSTGENRTVTFYVYVNRTANALPLISRFNNVVTSINLLNEILFNVSDNDLLIPDKEVYNETFSFSWNITNLSNLNQQLSIASFNITSSGSGLGVFNNTFKAKLIFNAAEAGNYSINITSSDRAGVNTSTIFNLTILSNSFPMWHGSAYFNLIVNSTFNTTISFYGNLTNSSGVVYANDSEGDSLSFGNSSDAMLGFNLSSSGIMSFTPYKKDVGFWNFSVTANDGYLSTTNYFVFNVSNINSPLSVGGLDARNASVSGKNIRTDEDNITMIKFSIYDDDSLITKSVYNETFNVSTYISSMGSGNLNFSFGFYDEYGGYSSEVPFENQTIYFVRFTPNKTAVGAYNVTLNVTDNAGNSFVYIFNLTVLSLEHSPNPNGVLNQTASITRVFNYNFSARDVEDGNSSYVGNYNFTFALNDSRGLLNFNLTNFNSTSGALSILFNNASDGKHLIYLNVSDSAGMNSSTSFWISIYGYPNITFPNNGDVFNVNENLTYNLTFVINHSVGDGLNYSFYSGSALINSSYVICNGSNNTLLFTPNFTQETYGAYASMSIFTFNPLYPELNFTRLFSFNIGHTNYPLENYNFIPNQSFSASLTLNLKEYFRDIDAEDSNVNQPILFYSNLINATSGTIAVSFQNWTSGSSPNVTFSSPVSASAIYSITANEYNELNPAEILGTVTSNIFSVTLNTNIIVITTPSGGGSSVPVAIKLIASSGIIVEKKGYFEYPFEVKNTGKATLNHIDLSSLISSELGSEVSVTLSNNSIASLPSGSSQNLTLNINVNTKKVGKYLITLFANSSSPKVSDWADISLNIVNSNETEAEKIIIFTEQLLVNNPECLELNELLKEAKKSFEVGNYDEAISRSQEAIDGCKKSILMNSQMKQVKSLFSNYYYYLILPFFIFVAFLVYVLVRRAMFKNKFPHYT